MRFVKQEVRRQVVPGCDGEEGEGSQEVVRGCARGYPLQLEAMVRLTFLPCAHASYGRGLGWWQHDLYLGGGGGLECSAACTSMTGRHHPAELKTLEDGSRSQEMQGTLLYLI